MGVLCSASLLTTRLSLLSPRLWFLAAKAGRVGVQSGGEVDRETAEERDEMSDGASA